MTASPRRYRVVDACSLTLRDRRPYPRLSSLGSQGYVVVDTPRRKCTPSGCIYHYGIKQVVANSASAVQSVPVRGVPTITRRVGSACWRPGCQACPATRASSCPCPGRPCQNARREAMLSQSGEPVSRTVSTCWRGTTSPSARQLGPGPRGLRGSGRTRTSRSPAPTYAPAFRPPS